MSESLRKALERIPYVDDDEQKEIEKELSEVDLEDAQWESIEQLQDMNGEGEEGDG